MYCACRLGKKGYAFLRPWPAVCCHCVLLLLAAVYRMTANAVLAEWLRVLMHVRPGAWRDSKEACKRGAYALPLLWGGGMEGGRI